jgi:hypothetical protein
MKHTSRAEKQKHMIVKNSEGARTSISIPELDVDLYIVGFHNCRKLFRRHLNAAAVETTVRPGRSFSEAVRMNIDRRLSMLAALN